MAVLRQDTRLADIIRTARSVVSQLDLDRALSITLKKAMDLTQTTAGSIALYYAASRSLRIHAHRGFPRTFIDDHEWAVRPGSLAERALRSRTVMVVSTATDRRFFSGPAGVDDGLKSLVCIPLIHHREAVGILFVDDLTQRRFPKAVLRELEILASFASIAIHHARMHTDVKHQAITDGLTGLFNRRSFESLLSRELQRADRHNRPFSLALVDVDDFKQFNDRYGHQAGDEALAALGEGIRKSIRSTDLAARYGGDEIVIILPETPLEKAYHLFAKRIKREIEQEFRMISLGRFILNVTVGISSYPEDGSTGRELVLAADRALLETKKNKHSRMIGCSRSIAGTSALIP